MNNNKALLMGKIKSNPVFDHEISNEKFYSMTLTVERLSEYIDEIPITVSEKLIDLNKDYIGESVIINGSVRTYNMYNSRKNKLKLSILAKSISFDVISNTSCNEITLSGFICKKPVLRKTPSGKTVCDVLLAVNRKYGKSDYIPCITWGNDALLAGGLDVGDKVVIDGRFQSRNYIKFSNENKELRTAYEISADNITVIID